MRTAILGGCILLSAVGAQAAAFVDDFDGSALDARWTASTTGTYGVAGGLLTAQMSGTIYSNPLQWNLFTTDAPVGDFVATMKCSVDGTTGWLPQVGIGLFSADHQSLMFTAEEEDYYSWGEFTGGAKFGVVTAQGTVTGAGFPFTLTRAMVGKTSTNVPFYLQLSRSGSVYTLGSSLDGTTFATDWTGAYSGTAPLTELGMAFFGSSAPQNGNIDWIAVTPEPGTLGVLAVGSVTLLRRRTRKI